MIDANAFQSTLPVWGATSRCPPCNRQQKVSIHAPRVGSDLAAGDAGGRHVRVSIHAPRVGSDGLIHPLQDSGGVSIHAPRVGSDRS